MKRILFIGIGKGGELLSFPETDAMITGLEPSDECRKTAKQRLSGRKDITLLSDSVFRYQRQTFDEIYLLFPAPAMLAVMGEELVQKVKSLLNSGGIFTMISEIWPNQRNLLTCIACERLSFLFKEQEMKVEEENLSIGQLPSFVRRADFLSKAEENIPLKFRRITAIKTNSMSSPERENPVKNASGQE